MKNYLLLFLFLIALFSHLKADDLPKLPAIKPTLCFTENKGQVADQNNRSRTDVHFSGLMGNILFHLRNSGISYQFTRADSWKRRDTLLRTVLRDKAEVQKVPDNTSVYRIDVNWLGSNSKFSIEAAGVLPGYNNYYLPSGVNFVHHVQSYSEVYYRSIYPGIDLHFYEKRGILKYDYIIAPGVDHRHIQLQVKGALEICIGPGGELNIKTPLGDISEDKPVVFQNGQQLQAFWNVRNDIVSFDIRGVDPNSELLIDPAVRAWGTYYGGGGEDFGYSVVTDVIGNVYMTGNTTQSSTLIATSGAHQTNFGGANSTDGDAYLVKFNAAGTRLWATYYGGKNDEIGLSCATYTNGDVYMVGVTGSTTGIATPGSYQNTFDGTSWDGFLVKFNSNGVRQWATYYGGERIEIFNSVCVDGAGNVFAGGGIINGTIGTWTALASPGAHQPNNGNGYSDGLLVKFNSAGIRQWATYYGGNGEDMGNSCACDKQGNVYLCGSTESGTGNTISTGSAHQSAYGGSSDAFLAKFNSAGVRQWATYYGGTAAEYGNSCATDTLGNIYMVGETWSGAANVISTPGAHQVNYGTGSDGFLVKFSGAGVRQWGTYYGGSSWDCLWCCGTDLNGNVFACGSSGSAASSAIATPGSHQTTWGGAFLSKFNTGGIRQWGTYYGGTGYRGGYAVSSDVSGSVYMAGTIHPTTGTIVASAGSHQQTYEGGAFDAYLVKFSDCTSSEPVFTTPPANQTVCANNSATLSALSQGFLGWFLSASSTVTLITGPTFVTPTLSAGVYTYYIQELACPSNLPRASITVTAHAIPSITVNTNQAVLCSGTNATLQAQGVFSYTWSSGSNDSIIIISPVSNSSYTVTGKDRNGCANAAVITVSVDACAGIDHPVKTLSNFILYPNPNTGNFTLVLEVEADVIIVDKLGREVYHSHFLPGEQQLRLADLEEGVYAGRLQNENSSQHVFRLIILK